MAALDEVFHSVVVSLHAQAMAANRETGPVTEVP